jgi:hypothetical protein
MAETITSNITTVEDLPSWMRDPLIEMISAGEELIQEPYTAYEGPRVADFTDLQEAGFAGVEDAASAGIEAIGTGQDYITGSTTPTYDLYEDYLNPYIEEALDPTARELEETFDKRITDIGAQAAENEAFGGSRHTLLESEAEENYFQEVSDLYKEGLAEGYDTSITAAGADQDRLLSAGTGLGQLAETEQDMALGGVDALLESGAIQQAQDQEELDVAYSDFLEQRDWPYSNLSWFSSLVTGLPQIGTVETSTSEEGGSDTADLIGAGLTGIGALDDFFK